MKKVLKITGKIIKAEEIASEMRGLFKMSWMSDEWRIR